MKSRHILMAAGLIASAGLVLFGDAPTAEVAKPLARSEQGRPSAASVRSAAPSGAARVASRSAAEASQILQLLPRQDLIAGERTGGDTERLFAAKTWQPPPAPPKVEAPPPPPSATVTLEPTGGVAYVPVARAQPGAPSVSVHDGTHVKSARRCPPPRYRGLL